MNPVYKDGILLLPTVLTLRDFQVYVSPSNSYNIAFYVEAFVNKAFSLASALDILDIQPDDGYVQFRRYFDDSWPRDDSDVIENVIVLDNCFNHICYYRSISVFK